MSSTKIEILILCSYFLHIAWNFDSMITRKQQLKQTCCFNLITYRQNHLLKMSCQHILMHINTKYIFSTSVITWFKKEIIDPWGKMKSSMYEQSTNVNWVALPIPFVLLARAERGSSLTLIISIFLWFWIIFFYCEFIHHTKS